MLDLGGGLIINLLPIGGRQPHREAWPLDRLVRERAVALGSTLDASTLRNYTSALTSFLTFLRLHNMPLPPTEDSLSFYIVFMCRHITPASVTTYLSGIIQQLEPFYPTIRDIRHSQLVQRTLQGCHKLYGQPANRKQALTISDLLLVTSQITSPTHDDLLFIAILVTGFFALLRLGEMVFPDSMKLRNWRKITRRRTVTLAPDRYGFTLPFHKADRLFAGNEILITRGASPINAIDHFRAYLASRDLRFPFHSPLWLRQNGRVPARSFFIRRLRTFFPTSIAGQSMRAGGATFLAELGVPPALIQARGRWTSDAFLIYIRKNPALLISLITATS